ncbi:hypothetical protein CTP45_24600 [Salmonella enterica]|nr:hypothetical protein [Salmonella enterica]ECG6430197.1 hypothetical protein [Salmonella enterica subsp. enterica serovar Saintpaul]EDW0017496.1 hypothetical protein [Salmonella enterica subsp. enterica serovar Aba]HCZ4727712.1 hypothetical protein [Salmonella enterica subsp. enterica serovar Saintpaul str. CFSAN004137]EAW8023119.1 hypothetical protein [Salmonella enterica]
MKYKELFTRLYYLDPTSPTGIRKAWNDEPAGLKQKTRHDDGYMWVIKDWFCFDDGTKQQIVYDLASCVYEMVTGYQLQKNETIYYHDVNKDNLNPVNMYVGKKDPYKLRKQKVAAYEGFRNVILPKTNPDYFNDPADWTDPEALAMLEAERQRRAEGTSKPPTSKIGRPRKWK